MVVAIAVEEFAANSDGSALEVKLNAQGRYCKRLREVSDGYSPEFRVVIGFFQATLDANYRGTKARKLCGGNLKIE